MRASIESVIVAPFCGVRMLSTSSMMWPQPVLDDAAAAGLAGEVALEGELERFLALVVDVGEADEVRHHFAGRVVAAVLALQENAGYAQLDDFRGLVRRQLALQVDELALGVGELRRELRGVRFEQAREARDLLRRRSPRRPGSPPPIRPAWRWRAARCCGRRSCRAWRDSSITRE